MTNREILRELSKKVSGIVVKEFRRCRAEKWGLELEDLVQEVLIKLVQQGETDPERIERKGRWMALDLIRQKAPIARHRHRAQKELAGIREYLKSQGRPHGLKEVAEFVGLELAEIQSILEDAPERVEFPEEFAEEGPGPEESTLKRQLLRKLPRAIERLPGQCRAVVVLHGVSDLSHKQIGEVFGFSPSRSCQLFREGIDKLREILEKSPDCGVHTPIERAGLPDRLVGRLKDRGISTVWEAAISMGNRELPLMDTEDRGALVSALARVLVDRAKRAA